MAEHRHDRISIDPRIAAGKPVVRSTRLPVERVLQHLAQRDRSDLFEAFPELTEDDVRACLDYAREAVERLHPARPNPTAA
jgi:uncharacterized protein (DUF433 family)